MRFSALIPLVLCALVFANQGPATASEKARYLELAKKGWNYRLRVAIRKDKSIPVHINGRDFAGATMCVVGDAPHPNTKAVLDAFLDLLDHSFNQSIDLRVGGQHAKGCGAGRVILLRLYSGYPPNRAFSADLQWINQIYDIGLPKDRQYAVTSPAQAQTYFGRKGKGTHIMVKQPELTQLGPLEQAFYTSILLEELYQSFTFGMDVLQFNPAEDFLSKLQETHLNLQRLPWDSRQFMRALLGSNPMRLCAFDVFMLHAIAQAPVDQTNDPAFIDFIDQQFAALRRKAEATMNDVRFAGIVDPDCARQN